MDTGLVEKKSWGIRRERGKKPYVFLRRDYSDGTLLTKKEGNKLIL